MLTKSELIDCDEALRDAFGDLSKVSWVDWDDSSEMDFFVFPADGSFPRQLEVHETADTIELLEV